MAEPDNFDTRDRPHIPIDVFRETAAYTFPSRKQERKRFAATMPRARPTFLTNSPQHLAIFRSRLTIFALLYRA
jgi:hypothetical protein